MECESPDHSELMWYVYRWNPGGHDWECIGAFSREDEARARYNNALRQWQAPDVTGRPAECFPGTCLRQSWADFSSSVLGYSLGMIASKIVAFSMGPSIDVYHNKDIPLV